MTDERDSIGRKPKVRLWRRDMIRIVDWLRANKDDLLERREQYETVAARASRDLDLEVTRDTLRGVLKDLDMLYRPGRGPAKPAPAVAAEPIEPIKPVEPIAPIVKQADLFLDRAGRITEAIANSAPVKDFDLRTLESFQSQLNSLRNKVATLASRLANAQETVAKASAETVSKLAARITAIEDALTKPQV